MPEISIAPLPEDSDWEFIALTKFYQIIDCQGRANQVCNNGTQSEAGWINKKFSYFTPILAYF